MSRGVGSDARISYLWCEGRYSAGFAVQRFLFLAIVIGALWAVDAYAFQGRYGRAVWDYANHQAQIFNNGVQSFVSKINP